MTAEEWQEEADRRAAIVLANQGKICRYCGAINGLHWDICKNYQPGSGIWDIGGPYGPPKLNKDESR